MDHQRMAILWKVQRPSWSRRADLVSPEGVALAGLQQLRQRYGSLGQSRPLPHPHRRQHRGQVLQQAGSDGHQQNGVLPDGRRGMRIRWWSNLPRWQGWAEAVFPGLDALQPDLVEQGQVCRYARRGQNDQPGPLSDAAAAHQWSRCDLGLALLHWESRGQGPHVGCYGHFPLDAQAVNHLVGGGWISAFRYSLLVGQRRNYTAWREYRRTRTIRLRRRRLGRDKRPHDSVHELRRTWQCLVSGSSPGPSHGQCWCNGQVLT